MWEDIVLISKSLFKPLWKWFKRKMRALKKRFSAKSERMAKKWENLLEWIRGIWRERKKQWIERKARLKERKILQEKECENKEWRRVCKFFVAISYWEKLILAFIRRWATVAFFSLVYIVAGAIFLVVCAFMIACVVLYCGFLVLVALLRLIIGIIIGLLILTLFFIHWVLRIILPITCIGVFLFVMAIIAGVVYLFFLFFNEQGTDALEYIFNFLKDGINLVIDEINEAIKRINKEWMLPIIEIDNPKTAIPIAFFSFSSVFLWKILGMYSKEIKEHIKCFIKSMLDILSPPMVKINKGIKKTCSQMFHMIKYFFGVVSVVFLVSGALLASIISSAEKIVMEDTNFVHNDVQLNFRNTAPMPLIVNPDNKDGKPLFAVMATFSEEAKLEDWRAGKYEKKKDCIDSQDSPDSALCAVKPDKTFYGATFDSFLKGLSACGTADNTVMLQTVGFASSSGILSTLSKLEGEAKEEVETKLKYGNKNSCYKRAAGSGSDDRRLSNAFNLCIAELRATNVKNMLIEMIAADKSIDNDAIEVIPHKWDSYSQMCQQRVFPDTKKEGEKQCYDSELGLMNRRVEVWVMELPECTNFFPNNRTPPGEAEGVSPESQGNTCDSRELPASCKAGATVDSCPNAGCQEARRSEP